MNDMMPAPETDECIRSLAWRLSLMQGVPGFPNGEFYRHFAAIVAQVFLSRRTLLENHSYIGYFRFVSKNHAFTPVHEQNDRWSSKTLLRVPNTVVRHFCRFCVEDDLMLRGQHYWRRAHQLPGVEFCPEHRAPLALLNVKSAETASPFLLRQKIADISCIPCKGTQENIEVQRFVELSMAALKAQESVDPDSMIEALRHRASAVGVRTTAYGKGISLGDLARSRMPESWIKRNFPALHTKKLGQHSPSVDDVFRTRHASHKTASYLLAMTLLWDTSSEALSACRSATKPKSIDIAVAGARALRAVECGASIRAACKVESISIRSFEEALRLALADRSYGSSPRG